MAGGGYWGGYMSNSSKASSGAGGSGYVSGHAGCIAINSQSDITPRVQTYTSLEDSYHYSGKVFTNTELTAGATDTSKATITPLSMTAEEYPILDINVDIGKMCRKFNPAENDYYIELDKEQAYPTITITTSSDNVEVEGGLVQQIETIAGETKKQIKVKTAEGIEFVYNLYFYRKPSSNSYLKNIKVAGKDIENYKEETLRYEIELPYNVEENTIIEAIKKFPGQTIVGDGEVETNNSTTIHTIQVTSEDETSTTEYNLILNKQPNTKLKFLDIKNQEFSQFFESDKYDYEYKVTSGIVSLNIIAIPYDDNAKVVVKGAGYIKEGKNTVTVTVSREGIEDTVYTITVIKGENLGEQIYDFPYVGKEYQTFVAPAAGFYKFEAWGARGGKSRINGSLKGIPGNGGYTAGTVRLNEGDTIYVYVGGKGTDAVVRQNSQGGWNGGGLGTWDNSDDESSGGGGGATDFRLTSGLWNDTNSLYSRIMVAGAGGGASWTFKGGAGGGLEGISYYPKSPAGTQTSGYALGIGKDAWGKADSDGVGGGGSGYYGGMTNNISRASAGSGGSSYISGHEGCKSTDENGNSIDDCIHTSGFKFKDTVMIDGEGYEWTTTRQDLVQMKNPQGNYVTGNDSDGYARITLLEDPSQNNLLKEIQINKGTITPEVNYDDTEYTVTLNPEDTELTIYGVVDDIKATVEGNGTYDIAAGENIINLKVTAENGEERTYTIKAIRDASNNSKPTNITIDGLIESIINVNPIYGVLNPKEFNPEVHEYSMTVPSRIKKLTFNVEKGHKYQTVTGDGTIELKAGENEIKINVTSEDGSSVDTYTYHITRDMSGNCLLESLSIDNVETDMVFDQDVLEYFVEVDNEVTSLDITAIPEMKEITPVIEGNKNLKVGLNDIYIIVNAPNGEQLVYIIHAYRKQSGNVFLSSLKVKKEDEELAQNPTFNKVLDTYTVTVPNEVESVTLEAEAEATTSSVSGTGKKTLKTGTNTYKIQVEAEDGSIGTYNVNINRSQSSNNYLKELITTMGNFNVEFDKLITEYEITVPSDTKTLPLVVQTEDKSATYKILQNNNFFTGTNYVIIRVTAENGEQRDYKIKVIKEASSNNYLTNIITSSGKLNPTFNKETLKYTVEVENEVDNIKVTAKKEDSASTVIGEGVYALEQGENNITLTVEAENGDIRTYELNVIRKQNSNTNLLRIDNDKNQIVDKVDASTYEINVRNEIDEITITAIPEKTTTKVVGNGKYSLEIGKNIITIVATAEDGTNKEYEIIVNRAKSDNAYLKKVFAKEGELYENFEKTTTEYHMKVQNNVESLSLEIETEDKDATYKVIGNSDFVYGENKVTIEVTASDGLTKKDYTIIIYRQPDLNQRCDLVELTVDKGTLSPNFEANTLVYEVNLPYEEDKINVEAKALDNTAIIKGTGEHELNVGLNVITVKVTSISGDEKVYQIKANRAKSTNANLSSLVIQNHSILPVFNKETTLYTVETKLSELEINATTEQEDATYEIIGNKNLERGTNLVIIKVTAPDGVTTKNYSLKVTKTGSDNDNLAFLSVNGYDLSPEFNKSTLLYNVNVPNNIETVYIDAIADDENATVNGIGIVKLEEGKNTFEVNVISESGKVKTYTIVINKGLSENAYLSDLNISEGTLEPSFDKLVNSYKVYVDYDVESINLLGYTEDSNATITGNGNYNLVVGTNTIELIVTAPNGNKNIYTVNVIRKAPISAKLSKLEVENYEIVPKFNENTNSYTVNVDNEITSLDMIIETLDPNATYTVTGNKDFVVGNNEVIIEVTSSDGLQKETYTIQVNRNMSSNNYLSYILPSKGALSPAFTKTNNNYTLTVENDITQINIDAEPEDSNATMVGNGDYTLEVGENKIEIKVTSSLGITRTYTVTIIRKKNSNNYLKNLVVKANSETIELLPIFDKENMSYEVTVPVGTTKVQLLGEAENSLSSVSGLGYASVKAGENNYEIKVTAENGDVRTYKILINRIKSTVNDLTDLIPSVGTLDPSFVYGTLEYNLTLGNADSLLSFEVATEDRFATVTGNEEQTVPDGESTRKIKVTAENGDIKTYTININRIRTDDARLKSLEIKSYTLEQEFNSDVYEYTLTVPNDKFVFTENEIIATPLYEDTKVYPTSSIELSVLKLNKYEIKTIAPDGYTTQTYIINIIRLKSSNSTLSKLAVSGCKMEPEFDSNTLEYTVYVPKGTTTLKSEDVIAVPTDEYATVVKSSDLDLTSGENVFDIDVTSHNGETHTTYKIKVIEEKSNNNYLESITTNVGTLSPSFDTNITQYKLHLTQRQNKLKIDAKTQDETATIESGTGTYNITEDTRILIKVRAEDGTLRIYIIDVEKDPLTGGTISGKITTENSVGKYKSTVTLYRTEDTKSENDEDNPREVIEQLETQEDGTFSFDTEDTQKYDIVVTKEGYLEYRVTDIEVKIGEETQLDTYHLLAGDVIKTGEIELDDLVAINNNYGEIINEENKQNLTKFDFNEDNKVDELDRSILKKNYGRKNETVKWKTTSEADISTTSLEYNEVKALDKEEIQPIEEKQDFIMPLNCEYTVTSKYGERIHPTTGEVKKHTGIDLSGTHHTEILAVASGEVTFAGVQNEFGNCVEIKHIVNGETIYSFYAHLSKINVKAGETVKQGQVIGLEGGDPESDPNPGNSTGHHLHFEIRNASGYGNDVDPTNYIIF